MKRLMAVVLLSACGPSGIADFQAVAQGAKQCDVTYDRCVLAGAAQCLCATPVNAIHVETVNEAAKQVSCGNVVAKCMGMYNPRCVAGTCVADQQ
jgi:hypothetical protein